MTDIFGLPDMNYTRDDVAKQVKKAREEMLELIKQNLKEVEIKLGQIRDEKGHPSLEANLNGHCWGLGEIIDTIERTYCLKPKELNK